MTARSLQQLLADNENEASLMVALESLDELQPPPASIEWARRITAMRNDLLLELKTIRSQGSLF